MGTVLLITWRHLFGPAQRLPFKDSLRQPLPSTAEVRITAPRKLMRFQSPRKALWKDAETYLVILALFGLLLGADGCKWFGSSRRGTVASRSSNAPNFITKTLDGKAIKLSDFQGKVVLMNFWAVWCGPCKKEVPDLVSLYKKYQDKGFVVLGISDLSDLGEIKSFVKEHGMEYPVIVDRGDISEEYEVEAFPTTILIDRNGKVVQRYMGYSPVLRSKLEALVQKLI
jgi:peroxiredoxin